MSESGEQPQTILVVLVGAAKAGKTTWARERFAASEIVPVDGLAAMTGGDAPDVASCALSVPAFDPM